MFAAAPPPTPGSTIWLHCLVYRGSSSAHGASADLSIVLCCSAMMVSEYEIEQAAEKFEESKQLAETAMHNLLENEVSTYFHA